MNFTYPKNSNNNNQNLGNEAVLIAAGLHLASKLCEPHECLCGSSVDPRGHHGLSCRRSFGRTSRHHNLKDTVWRVLVKAEVLAIKEPSGLSRPDQMVSPRTRWCINIALLSSISFSMTN